jgi:hypothetical protein
MIALIALSIIGNACCYLLGARAERKRCLDICSAYAVEHAWSPERNHAATMIEGQIK